MDGLIYALGFFDGIHIGHQQLLHAAADLAGERGCQWGVVTFLDHPDALVQGAAPPLINTPEDREWLLRERFSAQTVVNLPFDREMLVCPWRDFLDMLCREYRAVGFVCGADFRFGWRGGGTSEALADYCREKRLPCAVVPEQFLDGVRISSTYIRRELETGDMATAVHFLGHPHILRGTVLHGQALGRRLGFPTANLALPEDLVRPKFGVYACQAVAEGRCFPAVTNLGVRPTVEGREVRAESWILDYSGDLYGRELILEFRFFLRPEQKFDSLEALRRQIQKDAEQVSAFFKTMREKI